ncbi:MAG: ABC transporter ATP-binding protein [Owenweeksia sp.]|nr:ABC transporter ATP-binding protein [Owenweeksia sp.]
MALQTSRLHFKYDEANRFDFPDLNLTNRDQQLILGNSGHGKTTLLHLLAGILRPQAGTILINEVNLSELKNRQLDNFRGKNIGLVFQRSHFVKSINVKDNLLLSQKLAGKPEDRQEINRVLEELNISVKLSALPTQLSVGEQQRVSIARAVINKPALILADEPTSALDDENAERVAALLEKSASSQGANLVVVTHDQRLKHRFNKVITL